MSAKTHTHGSNRASKSSAPEKKVVFKSVLDNPYRVQWPSLPLNLQNALLARLLLAFDGVSSYQGINDKARRSKKRRIRQLEPHLPKKCKTEHEDATPAQQVDVDTSDLVVHPLVVPSKPVILEHLITGINQVTRKLESQLRDLRMNQEASDLISKRVKIVFVCKDDIDPPILISHLPHLIAAYNSACISDPIKIATLPRNSEQTLAGALGLRRVAILALDATSPSIDALFELLNPIPPLTSTWMTGGDQYLIPTHVKQLRTTAPTDMKGSKEKRVAGRRAAKERKKVTLLNQT
ncbi:hypothetical protein ONZ45_g188 [Pleurotus djamor]|nr:hypothetical protein ONZ45_g188 [Pleurotus djamor]